MIGLIGLDLVAIVAVRQAEAACIATTGVGLPPERRAEIWETERRRQLEAYARAISDSRQEERLP